MSLEKTNRNERIYRLSKRGGGLLSYRDIQRKEKFKSVKTVYSIVYRQHARHKLLKNLSKKGLTKAYMA